MNESVCPEDSVIQMLGPEPPEQPYFKIHCFAEASTDTGLTTKTKTPEDSVIVTVNN